jgi:predicted DNA-binding transcriptional regulator YafY
MNISFEFIAIDFFGIENIRKDSDNNVIVTFQTKNTEWVFRVFTEFGEKAKIISLNDIREKMKFFLKNTIKQYET